MASLPVSSTQLLVVGAGPVGLFGALCAARRGLDVLVLEQAWQGFGRGYAAILHPRSVKLLREMGVGEELFESGRRIDRVSIFADRRRVAGVELPSPGLAVAQSTLEEALLKALRGAGIKPHAPYQATTIEQLPKGVNVRVMRRELVRLGSPVEYSEWLPVESSLVHCDFAIGADGYDSRVRAALGIDAVTVGSTESFSIFEFPARSETDDLVLCFDEGLGSAMTPLPMGRARWSFQVATDLDRPPDVERLRALLAERAPWYTNGADTVDWAAVMHFERRLARSFGEGRVWLAGDAAHVTSPFGGQSLNGGLFEVYDLTARMAELARGSGGADLLEQYGRERRREWHKLLGVNVKFDLLPHAERWLAANARKLVPAFPASGRDLELPLERLGLRVQ